MHAFIPSSDSANSVRLAWIDEPAPDLGEAIVEVAAYSINRGETFLLENPSAGWRPGKDVAGRVVKAASDGSGPAVGARVVCHPGSAGWAERVAVPVDRIAALPDNVSEVQAAALPLAGLTALRLLRVAGDVAGRRVLLTGASGGVGHYFTELAAAAGARVTAVTATAERGDRLKALGAEETIRAVEETHGPFDVVLESVGGPSLPLALSKLKPRGELVWFGQASRTPPTLNFFQFWDGPVSGTIRHFDYTDSDIGDGEDLAVLVDLVSTGRLHPEIGFTADWLETPRALDLLRGRGVRGNAVLTRHPASTVV